MTIEIENSAKQSIDISTLESQEIVVTNTTNEQVITIEQDTLQEIDIDTAPLQEIEVEQYGITINVYDVPFYEGEYKVTPKVIEQTLPTARKILNEDVVIEKIPYFEVSNNSGGTTASIGEV